MLNKVPEVTVYFWIIKVLCTTVGETVADLMSGNLGLGEKNTAVVTAAILVGTLIWQFRQDRYVPGIYWLNVVLISIVGTLITDNLTDNYGVTTSVTTPIFAVALAITFAVWFYFERTLSIHTIFTRRRESFYWLAILFTFALGTAGGDLVSEKANLGYWIAAAIFAGAIALVTLSHFGLKVNAVLAFWLAYILTRPLGASMGDGLSASDNQGLGLGTYLTSGIFLAVIAVLVFYLTRSRIDQTPGDATPPISATGTGARVLVVAEEAALTPLLFDALRGRASRGPTSFGLLIPNPAPAEWHPTHPERHDKVQEAQGELDRMLPRLREAVGGAVDGVVSIRHDPMDAIEEELREGEFDEVILATRPHGVAGRLHADLAHRVAHLGMPVTTIVAGTPEALVAV
jgi:uncharacterized membrane-anchored protein